jgi:hypothetical protein
VVQREDVLFDEPRLIVMAVVSPVMMGVDVMGVDFACFRHRFPQKI